MTNCKLYNMIVSTCEFASAVWDYSIQLLAKVRSGRASSKNG